MMPPHSGRQHVQEMTRAARAELANAVRRRYTAAAGKDKRRILEEFIAATGYHEKSAIRVLNSLPPPSAARPVTGRRYTTRPFALR